MSPWRILLVGWLVGVAGSARAGIDVRVRGLGPEEADNVYAQIGILNYAKQVDAEHGAYDPAEVQRQFEQGEADIRRALQPFGWYNPQIRSRLEGRAPDWTAIYDVDAGPETDIEKLDVQLEGPGREDARLKRLAQRTWPLRLGQRLKHADYEAYKTRLLQAANNEGYLDASYTRHELRVDVRTNRAQVWLTLDTGPRWYFGAVTLEQDGQLKDSLLRRYLKIVPGEPFDSAKVLATQFALSDLDYFKSVEMEPRKDLAGPDRRIPVIIHTESKKPRVYKLGAGYGTDTGPRALAGVEWRRLNENGHKLRMELRPSQNISTGIAEYRIPWGTTPGDSLSFTAQGLKQEFQGIDEKLYSFGTAYQRQAGSWQRRFYLDYTNDDYALPGESRIDSVLLTPGLSLSRTEVDDPIRPRRGWFVFLDLHGATRTLASDTDFIEGLVKLRGVYPLSWRLRLLARAEEGAAFVARFQNLPPSQRFFAGGDESVRGYAYQSLGPKDAHGNLVGGKYLTTGSLELDWDVYKSYGLAVFGDAGGADDVPNVRLHYGAGLGLRYRAPFGAIAVDLAHPFDRGAEAVRLHLGVRVGL